MYTSAASPRYNRSLTDALSVAAEPLLYGVRLRASVCLALFVAFWLELENPFWAGASAAIVCLAQVGASLRKAWFRMIGTVIGATMIVVLTACFPQDRIVFLALLALWFSICALAATVLRNYASYAASLAGYTGCIADCLETSQFYVADGNRALADWWHDRANIIADRLETYRELNELTNPATNYVELRTKSATETVAPRHAKETISGHSVVRFARMDPPS